MRKISRGTRKRNVLIIANDSYEREIYKDVHKIYREAFESSGCNVTFATTLTAFGIPEYEDYDVELSNILSDSTKIAVIDKHLMSYDFIFISLFSVDIMREVYHNATVESLYVEYHKLLNSRNIADSRASEKVYANIRLLKIADRCKEIDQPYITYTFDPMIDMKPLKHKQYSFLKIEEQTLMFDLLSSIEPYEYKDTKECRLFDFCVCYNENLHFLDSSVKNVRNAYTEFVTKTLTNCSLYRITQFVDGAEVVLTNSNITLTNDNYRDSRKLSKFTFLLPNYDGMTISYRRFYEDLQCGTIPIFLYNDETSHLINQLPKRLLLLYKHHGLIFDMNSETIDSELALLVKNYDKLFPAVKKDFINTIKSAKRDFKKHLNSLILKN